MDSKFTVFTDPTDIAGAVPGTKIEVKVTVPWGAIGISPMHMIGDAKIVNGATVMRKEGASS